MNAAALTGAWWPIAPVRATLFGGSDGGAAMIHPSDEAHGSGGAPRRNSARLVSPVAITTAALVALALVLGLWLGQSRAPLTETQAIEAVAARHVAETGGLTSDCVAVPGEGAVWLRVSCGDRVYRLDAAGALLPPAEPQT